MTNQKDATESSDTRFSAWVIGAEKHSEKLGLRAGVWKEIYTEDRDWAFVLKIDSLLESACRGIVGRCLRMEVNGKAAEQSALDDFIGDLPIRGRVSLCRLLKISGCPAEHVTFIEAVRNVRNSYAHDVSVMEQPLIQLVLGRNDKSALLKAFSAIDSGSYDEAAYLPFIEGEPKLLRYGILCECLRFLTFSYVVIHADEPERKDLKRVWSALKASPIAAGD